MLKKRNNSNKKVRMKLASSVLLAPIIGGLLFLLFFYSLSKNPDHVSINNFLKWNISVFISGSGLILLANSVSYIFRLLFNGNSKIKTFFTSPFFLGGLISITTIIEIYRYADLGGWVFKFMGGALLVWISNKITKIIMAEKS